MEVTSSPFFLNSFFPEIEGLRDRARSNPPPQPPEQEQNSPTVPPIQQRSGDFLVFISPEAQLLQQIAASQDERQQLFEEATNQNEAQENEPPNEFVSVSTSIGVSTRLGRLTPERAIAIYRFIDTLR
ncbi:hypothetical protein EYS14_23085 [Alteromonadaceae bacterium M269]|nr:hypothetical protein EYS14_23085 [Alteromonadaceae bacterium M269]